MDLFYIILINKFHVTILTLYNRALLYVDIVQNRVNKTVTEKLSLQAFRAHIRLFRTNAVIFRRNVIFFCRNEVYFRRNLMLFRRTCYLFPWKCDTFP